MMKHIDDFNKMVAEELGLTEETVYYVMKHQWESIRGAMNEANVIEIGGLGTFSIRAKQIPKKLNLLKRYNAAFQKHLETEQDPAKRITLEKKIESSAKDIAFLQGKLDKAEGKPIEKENHEPDTNTGRGKE